MKYLLLLLLSGCAHKHDWVYSNNTELTYPPQTKRICKVCGKEEIEVIGTYKFDEYEEIGKVFKK